MRASVKQDLRERETVVQELDAIRAKEFACRQKSGPITLTETS
jgi:hypothetical protein